MPILTAAHVVISLIAIVAGAVVSYGFLASKRLDLWEAVFLATTVLTSVTGFIFFPILGFGSAQYQGPSAGAMAPGTAPQAA